MEGITTYDPYIETHTGKHVFFLKPEPEQIDIDDIAYALANQCRYNGHCSGYYSVAEHSVLVAQLLPKELKLAGLLHDASEAYLSDIPSPVKQFLPDYMKIEENLEKAIYAKFNILELHGNEQVRQADKDQLYTESHFLLPSQGKNWYWNPVINWKVNYDHKPVCLPPAYAYKLFMGMFYELTEERRIILSA